MGVKLYSYRTQHVDWWDGSMTLSELNALISDPTLREDIAWFWEAAKLAALSWQGDVSVGPYVYMKTVPVIRIPGMEYQQRVLGIAWKQGSKGITFHVTFEPLDTEDVDDFAEIDYSGTKEAERLERLRQLSFVTKTQIQQVH